MAQKYTFVRLPVSIYNEYKKERDFEVSNINKTYGKNIKLPMTKFFSAVILKHKSIKGLVPFNQAELKNFALKRRTYEF